MERNYSQEPNGGDIAALSAEQRAWFSPQEWVAVVNAARALGKEGMTAREWVCEVLNQAMLDLERVQDPDDLSTFWLPDLTEDDLRDLLWLGGFDMSRPPAELMSEEPSLTAIENGAAALDDTETEHQRDLRENGWGELGPDAGQYM